MDELDLARRAVRRDLLTEDQLREAQAYAAGGRSLLSVLLDLGYLKPQDVGDLTLQRPAPAPSGGSWFKTILLVGATAAVSALAARGCSDDGGHFRDRVVSFTAPPTTVRDHEGFWVSLTLRSTDVVRRAESLKKQTGTLSAETERQVQHAAALLTEAIAEGADGVTAIASLALAHELLDRWERAAEWYRKGLAREEHNAVLNLGLARILLSLDRPAEAHSHATAACSGETAGEAFLVRARASMELGAYDKARADLGMALQRDPALRNPVRALQQRLDE